MSQIRNFTSKFIKGALKFILYTTIILLLLLGGIIIALQFPSVQTKLVNKTTSYLTESLNFPIYIEGVDIDWFDKLVLEGVTVHDPEKGKMIYLQEAVVDFEILSFYKAKFNIDEITLRNGKVNMIKYSPDGHVNLTDFIDALREMTAPPKDPKRKPVAFTIDGFKLENMYFSYFDKRKLIITEGFDHNHFSFDSIYGTVTDFRAIADTLEINVSKLRSIENNTHLRIHELNTMFTLTKKDMTFEKLYARIGESVVKDYMKFQYNHINDLSSFNDKVDVTLHLDETILNFNNLSEFAPGLKPYHDNIKLSGLFNGKVENFKAIDFTLGFGKASLVKGNISFNGLPDFEETFMEFKFLNSAVQATDLKQYLDNNSYSVLKKFGKISANGKFIGFPHDFVTQGSFNTDLGDFVSDIRLNAKDEDAKPEYEGRIKTYAFNLGKLMDMPDKVQLIDMDGKIKGAGFSLETAELNLNASISRLGINRYNYKNIKTNAKLTNSLFNGELSVKDSNLIFQANGKIDLAKGKEIFDIQAHFERANLKPLNLSSVETLVKTDFDLNFQGTKIDDIVGEVTFTNTSLFYKNHDEIFIDLLYGKSTKNGDHRTIDISSNLASLKAEGNFTFTALSQDLERLYKEYELNIINDKVSINNYYSNKITKNIGKYNIDFDLDIKNLNTFFEIYAPGLYLSQGLTIEGEFISGNTSILNINTRIDTLFYKENEIYNTDIELSTSKLADSSNVLAMLYVTSSKQKLDKFIETKNFSFEGIWDKRMIDFATSIQQPNSSNNLNLNGNLSFLENKKLLKFSNSSVNLLNKTWNIPENNKIVFSKKEITFENFTISNNNQSISLDGTISDNSNKVAEFKVSNFELASINSLLTQSHLGGTLNGNIFIKDLYRDLDMGGNVSLNDFTLDGFLVGNIVGTSKWDRKNRNLDLDLKVLRSNIVTISLKGYIKPQTENKKEELNLVATLDNADLEILGPILKGTMSDLSGKVTGDFTIKGTLSDIALEGRGDVKKGRLKIDYLGTTYYFDDHIYLEENMIGFKKLKLKDEHGNTAIIDGGIYHDSFKKFVVDIKGSLNHVNVLNTTEKDNKLFYGIAFVTGDMEVLGPFSNLQINANAISNKGTKIHIPLNTFEGLEQQSYITFKARETKKNKKEENSIDLSGIKLDFNFELTPDAYAEIIFDKRAGDIIRGYGNGNIKMTIDTRGDFNMYGSYRIARGAYNYTLAGLINKEFTIQPNSSITWSGDPYGGLLDVKAYFANKISIAPLISDSVMRKQEIGRTHPVKVILDLDGDLMSPQIALDIDITPTTGIATEVATKFESDIKRNEQELNRQVFSLLVLGNFSPENSFTGIAGSTSNVSQLLTNQLGNWLSQVDENLVVDIDLNGLDKEALNTFNLRLSYTLLDGRLRISRDGSFSNFQNSNQQSVSNIAGEWTVEYLLSKEGKFRLKLYNRNNQNALLNSLNAGNNTSAGFSVLHTQTFANLSELLGLRAKKPKPQKN